MSAIEPYYIELGRRVRAARERKGWPQAELGRQMSPPLTRSSIANIEGGKQRVLCHTIVQLAAVLGVDVRELVGTAAKPDALAVARAVHPELRREVGPQIAGRIVAAMSSVVVTRR